MSRNQLDDAWQAMKILKNFSLQQVRDAVQVTTLSALKEFAKRLVSAGVVEEHIDFEDVRYTLLKPTYDPFKPPLKANVQATGRQKMWQSMRILNEFDAAQVASTSGTSLSSARSYISILKKAGYIFVVKEAMRSGTIVERAGETTIYKLLKNTGPTRPIPKANGVFDVNKNELVEFGKMTRKTPVIAPRVTLGETHDYN